MKTEYKRDLHHSYLILTSDDEIETESYGIRMITGHIVPCLLPCKVCAVDGEYSLYYEITSCQELSSKYENRQFREGEVKQIIEAVISALESMKEFLLPPENLLIRPEYLFERGGKELCFCYLPGYSRDIAEQLREFLEYILPKICHEDPEAVAAGYGIYRGLMEEGWNLECMKQELYGKKEWLAGEPVDKMRDEREDFPIFEEKFEENRLSPEKTTQGFPWRTLLGCLGAAVLLLGAMTVGYFYGISWIWPETLLLCGIGTILTACAVSMLQWGMRRRKGIFTEEKLSSAEKAVLPEEEEEAFLPEEETEYSTFFGYPSEEEECEETVMMYHMQKHPKAVLVPEDEQGEEWYLRGDLVMIGKMKKSVDICLSYPTISRIHAKIRKEGEEYFLSDLHSRNGTKCNGKLLNDGEEVLLHPDDRIEFAEYVYRFCERES